MNYARELTPTQLDPGLSGLLDSLQKIVGGAVKIVDKIRTGGRIVIAPPGMTPVELDTRDPAFLDKLRQYVAMFRGSVSFESGARQPSPIEEAAGAGARFFSSPVGIAVLVGGGLLAFSMLSGRRR